MLKFRVKAGKHIADDGLQYGPGEVFEHKYDLSIRPGWENHVERVPDNTELTRDVWARESTQQQQAQDTTPSPQKVKK